MAQISNTEGGKRLSDTFLLKIVRTTRLKRRFAAEKWGMRDDYPPRFTKRAAARQRNRLQGRDAAPPGSDLRGKAAIASRRNAASRLKLGTPRAWRALPRITSAARRLKKGTTPCGWF